MLDLLSGFVEELRRAGLPVSLTEHLDAAEAVHHIPIEDREALKYALGATLVKSASHWHAFETTFDIYFASRPRVGRRRRRGSPERGDRTTSGRAAGEAAGPAGRRRGDGQMSPPRSSPSCSTRRCSRATEPLMRLVARHAVTRYAGIEPGRPVGGTYYLYRTLRNLELDGVLERLVGAPDGRRAPTA